MVVIRILGLQEVPSEVVGEAEDFSGVAVVESQDSGTPTRLNARAGKRELQAALLVDGLGVVVEQQQ